MIEKIQKLIDEGAEIVVIAQSENFLNMFGTLSEDEILPFLKKLCDDVPEVKNIFIEAIGGEECTSVLH